MATPSSWFTARVASVRAVAVPVDDASTLRSLAATIAPARAALVRPIELCMASDAVQAMPSRRATTGSTSDISTSACPLDAVRRALRVLAGTTHPLEPCIVWPVIPCACGSNPYWHGLVPGGARYPTGAARPPLL